MRFFLNQFDYEDKDTSVVYEPDPLGSCAADGTSPATNRGP